MKTIALVVLLVIGVGRSSAQLPVQWVPVVSSPFVLDTLTILIGHSIVFRGQPVSGAIAQHMHNDTIRLGAFPDSSSPEYVVAHEVGHMWSEEHRADSAVLNILLIHDAQELIGGYAAKSPGEHAAEAFAYAVLILRLPEQEQAAMLARVEPLVLGTTVIYYQLRTQLVRSISAR